MMSLARRRFLRPVTMATPNLYCEYPEPGESPSRQLPPAEFPSTYGLIVDFALTQAESNEIGVPEDATDVDLVELSKSQRSVAK